MSPSISLRVMIMEFTSIVISLVSASILLMTRLVGTVMTVWPVWLVIITTTITTPPLVFVIVILLERIVLQLAVIRVWMMAFQFLHLRKGELYPLAASYDITIKHCMHIQIPIILNLFSKQKIMTYDAPLLIKAF
jgi:hypothetical protein